MKTRLCVPLLLIGFSGPAQAGGSPDLVFLSGFEGVEACAVFDGVGDTMSIPVISLTGDFMLNGGAFPANEFDDAVISLRDRLTGDVFELGNTHDLSYTANIVPGDYDVIYSVETPGGTVPVNENAVLLENLSFQNSGSMDIEVTAHLVSGDLTHNGAPFPAIEFDDALIFLDSETAGTLQLGETNQGSFSNVPVLGGKYHIRYQVESPGDTVPWNEWGLVGQVEVTGNDANMDIDVVSILLGGVFSHNGAPMPAIEFDDGNFYLETNDGDRVFLENSHFQAYSRRLIPGIYDVFWELESLGDTVPFNERARVGSGIDVSSGVLNIDVDSYSVSGNFTLNGAAFPNSVQHTARMVLRDSVSGTDNVLGFTHEGTYDHQVIRSAYDVVYQYVQGDQVPENTGALVSSVVVKSDLVLDVDVEAGLFSAPVFHNGVLFEADQSQAANIILRNPTSDDRVVAGRVSQQTVSAMTVGGTYDVYYNYLSGDAIPVNDMARIHEGVVIAPVIVALPQGGGLQLQVDSRVIGGQILLNDVSPPASQLDNGDVSLQLEFDSIPLGATADQAYSVRIIDRGETTVYQAFYSVETSGATVPRNQESNFECVLLEEAPPL